MREQFIHINEYGTKRYYKDHEMTILHREDGPAVEYTNGDKLWYINGKLHREDGFVIEYVNGSKSWYLNGEYLTEEEFNQRKSPTVEMTLEEVAKKFGLPVDKLRIKD